MDLHQNARLTFRSREALANQIMLAKGTKNRRQPTERPKSAAGGGIQAAYCKHPIDVEEGD